MSEPCGDGEIWLHGSVLWQVRIKYWVRRRRKDKKEEKEGGIRKE